MSIDNNLAKMAVTAPKPNGPEVLVMMDRRLDNIERALNKFQGDVLARLDAIQTKLTKQEESLKDIGESTKKVSPCSFCPDDNPDNHLSWRCGKYPNTTSRMRRAMELGLCLRCLQPQDDEMHHQCDMKCAACGGEDHHALLCASKPAKGPARKRMHH